MLFWIVSLTLAGLGGLILMVGFCFAVVEAAGKRSEVVHYDLGSVSQAAVQKLVVAR